MYRPFNCFQMYLGVTGKGKKRGDKYVFKENSVLR
jgi:hypothetical protein